MISYNRENIIEACLRSLRFADELVILDKGSNDRTVEIAKGIADKVIVTEWSPTVEESRVEASALCQHENIVFLDDDECLSAGAADFLLKEDKAGFLDAYFIPCKHYILGQHSPNSYYWPERQLRAFRRGAVDFLSIVHGGIAFKGKTTSSPHYDTNIYFANLSHVNVSQWIEKSNRYTSQPNRTVFFSDDNENSFHEQMANRLRYWMVERTQSENDYDQIVAALRAIYDLIDFIKHWESEIGMDGRDEFEKICRAIIESHTESTNRAAVNDGPATITNTRVYRFAPPTLPDSTV